MMTNKKRLYSIFAVLVGIIVCFTLGIVFALDKKEVSAENATEYETYDVLYTDDFTVNGVAGGSTFEVENDKFLNFTPSAGNTSASFVWNFKYTATKTTGEINIYPLASGSWGSNRAFNFNGMPNAFEQGKTYDVEFGVKKIKNSDNYYVYVKVNNVIKYQDSTYVVTHGGGCATNGCGNADFSKHTGLYLYVLDGAKGTCNSARPQVKFDKLNNSDWKIGGKGGASVPNEWIRNSVDHDNTYIDFNPSPENTTKSFIWEFDFLCTSSGKNFNIFPFAGQLWPGTRFIDIANAYSNSTGFEEGEIYKIEVGVVEVRNNVYKFYTSVDGNELYSQELSGNEKNVAGRGDGLSLILNGTCKGIIVGESTTPAGPVEDPEEVSPYADYVDTYDTLYNMNWRVYSGNPSTLEPNITDTWTMQNQYFLDYKPSATNTTHSFVWKFNYTHSTAGVMNIYPFAGGAWVNTSNDTFINFNSYGFEVGNTYEIELCLLKLKNSSNYEFFVVVNGTKTATRLINETLGAVTTSFAQGYNGLYCYFLTDAKGIVSSAVDYTVACEKYDVLDNADWKLHNGNTLVGTMPQYWTPVNANFINFTPSAENTTGSFIWNFKYTMTASGTTANVYPLASGSWGSGSAPISFNSLGLTDNKEYDMQFGVIRIKNRAEYYLFIKADGNIVKELLIVPSHNEDSNQVSANGCPGGDDYSKHTGIYFYISGYTANFVGERSSVDLSAYVDTYDTLYNMNWRVYSGNPSTLEPNITDTWTMQNERFIDYQPSATNTTHSFVWKFKYTHNNTGAISMFAFTGGHWVNTDDNPWIDFHNCGFEVGKTYDVELCLLKLKNSSNYEFFAVVNGTKVTIGTGGRVLSTISESSTVVTNSFANNYNGLYISGSSTSTVSSSVDYTVACEDYEVLTNSDFITYSGTTPTGSLPVAWEFTNQAFINPATSHENTTGSFIWNFKYKATGNNGQVNIYPLASGSWGSKSAPVNFNALGLTPNQEYDIEFGVIKVKNRADSYVFVKADGNIVKEMFIAPSHNDTCAANGCAGGNDYSKHTGLYFYLKDNASDVYTCTSSGEQHSAYETYDVLYNSDWSVYNGVVKGDAMPSSWSNINDKFINFTPSAENTTGSFIWKFKYTATASDTLNVYPLASAPWGGTEIINFSGIGLALNTELDIELGVLRIKASDYYHVFVKADGVMKHERYIKPTHGNVENICNGTVCACTGGDDYSEHTGIYFYLPSATGTYTFKQDKFYVSVNNGEEKIVDSGTTIYDVVGGVSGLIPAARPNGYSVAWYDENGNKVNAFTPISGNTTIVPFYTYNYKILNVNGEEIYKNKHVYGEAESYNGDKLSVGRTTFIGYLVGDKLYQDLAEAIDNSASTGKSLIANTISFGLVDGASVRIIDEPTIRFSAAINKSEVDEGARIVDFGMLLTTKSTLDMIDDFTIEELDAVDSKLYHNFNKESGLRYVENAKYAGQYVYSLVLNKVSLKNYCLEYAARAYAIVEYEDGTQKVVYSCFDKVDNVRSMYDVAVKAIADTNANYTNDQIAIIQKVIDGVVNLDDELTLTGPERNYTVNVLNSGSGDYTVTVNPLNGFSIASIGAVLVNGEQIPVYNANLVNRSFVIKDDDMCVFTMKRFDEYLANYDAERELVINAYSGPSIGLKVNASGSWENSGYNFTLADLKTYMDAGFDSWRLEISPYTSVLGYTANGTTYNGDSKTRDIYKALDLAAEYARTYGKPCAIYVNIPEVTGLVTSDLAKIKQYYDILTNYDDGITGRNGVPSAIAGKHNQIAGFLLKDEPSISQEEDFTTIYNYLKNTCGANASGYKYMISLLQTYAGADLIGNSYEDYVATYSEILSDTTIGFDSYPFAYEKANLGGQETYSFVSAWYYNMQVNRAQANGYGTCIQSYTADSSITNIFKSKKYKKINSEQEISMQVYTALAYGFTNIDYFTYGDRIDYDRQVREEIYQQVPVKWNNYANWSQGYTKTDMYYWIQNTNSKAISLYEVLGKFTSNGVQLIHGTTTFNNFGEATTTNTTNAIGVSSTYDMVVGGFNCGSQNGYLAVNVDFPNGSKTGGRLTTATFNLGNAYTKAIVYIDGEERVEHLTNGSLTLKIASGEAAFIVPMN